MASQQEIACETMNLLIMAINTDRAYIKYFIPLAVPLLALNDTCTGNATSAVTAHTFRAKFSLPIFSLTVYSVNSSLIKT